MNYIDSVTLDRAFLSPPKFKKKEEEEENSNKDNGTGQINKLKRVFLD